MVGQSRQLQGHFREVTTSNNLNIDENERTNYLGPIISSSELEKLLADKLNDNHLDPPSQSFHPILLPFSNNPGR
ncbi:unnamed protein product [Allacma fusca]|uniref:Uncharacterized protein n=1 Tax=Allacma fusca TaxID=39272 RepID=A0A8J2PGE2_9HEXA|nr:unnamed protein product [Allacma fusca]